MINFELFDKNYHRITQDQLTQITLLDFWNSRCGPCYKEFPIADSLYEKMKANNITFFTVNVPMNNEKLGDNFSKLDRYGYRFSNLFASTSHIIDSFGVLAFPTTLVIKDNKIVFRGKVIDAYEYAMKQ